MAEVVKGPMWIYTIPPNTKVVVKDQNGVIQFAYENTTFYIKWLDKPFYVRPGWTMEKIKI